MTALDPTIVVAIVGLASGLIGSMVSRSTETRRIIAGAPAGYSKLVDDLQQERTELRAALIASEGRVARALEIQEEAERRAQRLDQEVAGLRTRVRGLERDRDADHRKMDVLIEHVRVLRTILRAHKIEHPDAPTGHGLDALSTPAGADEIDR